MFNRFISFIESNQLFRPEQSVLLAVSGGVDSMVMLELFREAGFRFAIAHANFGLRAGESDADEALIRDIAERYQVPVFINHFNTTTYAKSQKLSIQMAARQLRYNWFTELCHAEGFAVTATAHHLDDQAETFFINLLRGAGISGLHGILPRQGNLIRPMLFATREQILQFATGKNLNWRNDSSNQNRKYLRNRLRLDVLPGFYSIDRYFGSTLDETIRHLRDAESILHETIAKKADSLIDYTPDADLIRIAQLKELEPLETWLFELLKPYHFSYPVIKEIVSSLNTQSGKIFYSATHRLVRDRENLIIQELSQLEEKKSIPEEYRIEKGTRHFKGEIELEFFETPDIGKLNMQTPFSASLDAVKLTFPLTLRKWRQGDTFIPLGCKGRKKLSDFFIDQKFSLAEKEKVWVLVSGREIVWVIGHRIDHRYRIRPETTEVLQVILV